MSHINLLPWREKKRQREQQRLLVYLVVGGFIAVTIIFLMYQKARSLTDRQVEENQRLQQEIAQFEQQIKAIKQMKIHKGLVLAKMRIIENLQMMQTRMIHLLNEVGNMMPDDVYLSHFESIGHQVYLLGYADSTRSISALIRRIAGIPWISEPSLSEIKTIHENKEFKLHFSLKLQSIGAQS